MCCTVPSQQKSNDVKQCLREVTKIKPFKKIGYQIEQFQKSWGTK